MIGLASVQKEGGFDPSDVSPEEAVAARPFAVLLILRDIGSPNSLPAFAANL
jgi:hypothetical protein